MKIFFWLLIRIYIYIYKVKKQYILWQFPNFKVKGTFDFKNDIFINLSNNSSVLINGHISFRNYCSIQTFEEGLLIINDNVFFNNYCSINCVQKITIGKNSIFGEGVKIYDHNHQYKDKTELIKYQSFSTGEIIIEDNCWIGSNVTILKGVRIGKNCVIGANNLIYKSVPENSIVLDNSDKQIKEY